MKEDLDRLRIATPCSTSWERMEGDERVRHCAVCSLNVYNIAEMTRDEVRELIARNEGRVCVRLYRRADGTVLTRDCPKGLRELGRRASRAAAAAVAALISLPAFGFTFPWNKPHHGFEVKLTTEQVATAQPAAFTGVVVLGNDPLPGATVVLRDKITGREVAAVTDGKGAFTFQGVSDGTYRADLTLAGFKPARIDLELKAGAVVQARVAMQIAELETITVGGAELSPLEQPGISTTFLQSFIDKLP